MDQKLAACVGAESGKEDLDTGKGDEGDVEARCFRKSVIVVVILLHELKSYCSGQNEIHLNHMCWSCYSSSSRVLCWSSPG